MQVEFLEKKFKEILRRKSLNSGKWTKNGQDDTRIITKTRNQDVSRKARDSAKLH